VFENPVITGWKPIASMVPFAEEAGAAGVCRCLRHPP
jgi:hypothetical protein